MLLSQVRTLHSLDHSNVLKFYAWYETSAHLWLVLEYCVGGDLLTLLRQDTRLPEESIHDFARDLVHALQFLHSKGVIYCDLKPSNILLDENGRLKLCDFGLARRLSDISKNSVQQSLLNYGADVNSGNWEGATALHLAVDGGWTEAVKLLLAYGAKVDSCNKNGLTPVDLARQEGQKELLELLENPPKVFLSSKSLPKREPKSTVDQRSETRSVWPRNAGFKQLPSNKGSLPFSARVTLHPYHPKDGEIQLSMIDELNIIRAQVIEMKKEGEKKTSWVEALSKTQKKVEEAEKWIEVVKKGKGKDIPTTTTPDIINKTLEEEQRRRLPQAKRGTPCYMAPELFLEGGVHSFASDLWALGCVMYECYAGRPPFVSNSFTQLVNSILSDPTPCLQGNPSKELQDLVARLLTKDPAKRLQWSELCQHPFWRVKMKLLHLPPQPAFTSSLCLLQQEGVETGSPAVTQRGNQDQPFSRLDRASRKPEVQPGHKKTTVTPSKDTEASENMPSSKAFNIRNQLPSRNTTPLKEDRSQKNCGVNLLRLSKIVKTNLERETEGGNYRQQVPNPHGIDADLMIENNDLELDFAERMEDDSNDEEDAPDSSTSSDVSSESEKAVAYTVEKTLNVQSCKMDTPTSENASKSGGNEVDLGKGESEKTHTGLIKMEVAATPPGVGLPRRVQRSPLHPDQKKLNLNSPAQGTAEPLKTSLVISQALWHPSDLAVRPIMVFKRSERLADPGYDSRTLPFDPISISDLMKLSDEELELFLNKVLGSISGNTSLSEKLNTLKYLETLCTNVEGANALINSPLMHMLVKMLRTSKPPAIRIQVIFTMGLLIRHATLIEEDLASSGIITVLSEGLRDKQDKVRRCSMATLGELLFYIATQNEGSPRTASGSDAVAKESKSASAWQVPSTLIALVASILRKGEDDITQHYALKTIENISSQGGEWSARFTNHAVLENLCYIFKASAKQESVRLSAGSCLVRLLRFSSSAISLVLDKLILKDLAMGLTKGNPREQQVNINLLNMCLMGNASSSINKQLASLLEEKTLISALLSMLEQSTEVLRGKSSVCAALLCKVNRRWLAALCGGKLLAVIERLSKEKDSYAKQCIDALIQSIVEVVPNILESIGSDVQQLANGKRLATGIAHTTPQSGRSQSRNSLYLFSVALHLFESPVFKEKTVNGQVLKQLAGFLNSLQVASFQGLEDFQATLLRIFEVFGQQSSIPLTFPEVFLREVLPSLAILYRKNSSGDTRFLCLKIFFDVLVVYLDDIANSGRQGTGKYSSGCASQEDLHYIAKQQFLPYYSKLMDDDDPIPMYAQKLLVMLLDIKCIKIEDILHLQLFSQFFDFLRQDFSTINLHNIRLCHFLASSVEVKTSCLSQLEISGRVGALLEFVHARDMEDFLEPSLSLCKSLLMRSTSKERGEAQGDGVTDIGEFGKFTSVFLELCCRHEALVAELAAECMLLLVRVNPTIAALLLTSKMPLLRNALESSCSSQGSRAASRVQKLLLLTVSVACKEQRLMFAGLQSKQMPVKTGSDIMAVLSVVGRLKNSNVQMVVEAATDAGLELQGLLNGITG
ncbi:hypothetical protein L7F22_042936 [Adiantum nelumboides]|nr:hypothetical protein [Adiantum nelumboides]